MRIPNGFSGVVYASTLQISIPYWVSDAYSTINDGRWYSIDFERKDERTIQITNAWNLSDNPYLP